MQNQKSKKGRKPRMAGETAKKKNSKKSSYCLADIQRKALSDCGYIIEESNMKNAWRVANVLDKATGERHKKKYNENQYNILADFIKKVLSDPELKSILNKSVKIESLNIDEIDQLFDEMANSLAVNKNEEEREKLLEDFKELKGDEFYSEAEELKNYVDSEYINIIHNISLIEHPKIRDQYFSIFNRQIKVIFNNIEYLLERQLNKDSVIRNMINNNEISDDELETGELVSKNAEKIAEETLNYQIFQENVEKINAVYQIDKILEEAEQIRQKKLYMNYVKNKMINNGNISDSEIQAKKLSKDNLEIIKKKMYNYDLFNSRDNNEFFKDSFDKSISYLLLNDKDLIKDNDIANNKFSYEAIEKIADKMVEYQLEYFKNEIDTKKK